MTKRRVVIIIAILLMVVVVLILPVECHRRHETHPVTPEKSLGEDEQLITVDTLPMKENLDTVRCEGEGAGGQIPIITPTPVHDRRTRLKKAKALPAQLTGEWLMGTWHEEYHPDGTGLAWDTEEDIRREEAHHFNWILTEDCLVAHYLLTFGGIVPNITYITEVDSTHMVRCDDYGNNFFFKKKCDDMIDSGERVAYIQVKGQNKTAQQEINKK